MASVAVQPDRDGKFTRKQAAKYLREAWSINIAPKTLANMASNNNAGKGPAFTRYSWKTVLYEQADLDAWGRQNAVRVE